MMCEYILQKALNSLHNLGVGCGIDSNLQILYFVFGLAIVQIFFLEITKYKKSTKNYKKTDLFNWSLNFVIIVQVCFHRMRFIA